MSDPAQIDKLSHAPIQVIDSPSKIVRQRSSHNAIKHGIFSDVTVLPGESRSKYHDLLTGLSDTLQPEGRLEELLVEKLAMLAGRHRRLLGAEGAEIRQSTEFLEWDQRIQQTIEAEPKLGCLPKPDPCDPDLIRKIQDPDLLEQRIELLREFKQAIKRQSSEAWLPPPRQGCRPVYGRRNNNRRGFPLGNADVRMRPKPRGVVRRKEPDGRSQSRGSEATACRY